VIESEKDVERETGVELGETSPLHLEDMIGIEGKKHAAAAAATTNTTTIFITITIAVMVS